MITIISGLPRAGTSMLMQMLRNGGMEILSDKVRQADESNPKGYWEYEKVKILPKDNRWLLRADGKAVKIIAQLLKYIPPQAQYKIIFMERDLNEILASQGKMLERLGKEQVDNNVLLKAVFMRQLDEVKQWLYTQNGIETLFLNYTEVIQEPMQAAENIVLFLNKDLDRVKMSAEVDADLYREKNDFL